MLVSKHIWCYINRYKSCYSMKSIRHVKNQPSQGACVGVDV